MLIIANSYTQAALLQLNYMLSTWLHVLHGLAQSLQHCHAGPEAGCALIDGTFTGLK